MLHERIDRYMRASRSFYNVNRYVHCVPVDWIIFFERYRWIGIRLDALGRMFTISLAFYLVYGGMKADASTVGFILSLAGTLIFPSFLYTRSQTVCVVSFSDMILSWVRVYNAFEGKEFLCSQSCDYG